jgi:threonine aldolase
MSKHFVSDNYAGICPEAFAAFTDANTEHAVAYGEGDWTQ